MTASATGRRWRRRLRQLPQQALPSQVVVPGLLDGLGNINRLVDQIVEQSPSGPPAPAPAPAWPAAARADILLVDDRARFRLHPEGLSAPFGDLHRAGDPRAGAARHSDLRSSRCAIRPTNTSSGAPRDRGAGQLPAGISLPGAAARAARLVAGTAAAGLSRGVPSMARRFPARPHPQSRPALRPGLRAGGRAATVGRCACTRISSTRRPRSPATRI